MLGKEEIMKILVIFLNTEIFLGSSFAQAKEKLWSETRPAATGLS